MALLVVGTVGVLAAAAGPLYLATANDSVLHSVLLANPPSAVGLTVTPRATAGQVGDAQAALEAASRYRLGRWYAPQKVVMDAGMSVNGASGQGFGGDLVSDPGACSHLHFLQGSCPTGPGQVAITQRSATALGAKIGSRLSTSIPGPIIYQNGLPTQGHLTKVVTVTGIVAVSNPSLPFWFGADYFGFGQSCPSVAPRCLPQLDSFFTPPGTVAAVPGTLGVAELHLKVDALHLSVLPLFNSVVGGYENYLNTQLQDSVSTRLPQLADQAHSESQLMQSIVLVVDLQLVLLALFVLFGLVARTAEARQKEVALARLRGFRLSSVLSVGLLEPLAMLVLAVPLGLALAYVLMALVQPLLLPGGLLTFQPLALGGSLAAFAGGLLAVGFGARRIISRRLADELRATEPKISPATRAALDGAGLALAVAGILELVATGVLNGGQPNPVAAFAPGLVAVAVAIAGMRGLPLLARLVVRRTRNTGQLGLGLAVRQVVRRPASLRQIAVLAVATALACFAVAGWAAAGVNRVVRANFTLGAARVLTVQVPVGVSLEQAVDRADPSGRYAMAVMLSKIPSQNLLAVQVSRLEKVGYWPPGVSTVPLRQLVNWLRPHLRPELVVRGSEVRVTVTMEGSPNPPPDLQLELVDGQGNPGVADFGFVLGGTHTYTTALPPACLLGCHALQLNPIWTPTQTFVPLQGEMNTGPQSVSYQLTVSQLEQGSGGAWGQVTSQLGDPSYWSGSGPGISVSGTTVGGQPALHLDVKDQVSDTSSPSVYPGALPAVLPGVVTRANAVQDPAAASVEDFDGTSLTLNVKYQVAALPELGQEGFLVDLSAAVRAQKAPPTLTQSQVWLAADTPGRVVAELRGQGQRLLSSRVPGTAIAEMNRGGLALAYLFFLFAAAAAAVLAIGASVFSVFMTSRRRAFELAVLRAIGLSDRTLLGSRLGEQLLVLGPGVLLGVVAGLVGVVLALPSVPEFSTTAGGPPVQLVVAPVPIVLMVGALVLLLAVAAWLAAATTLRLSSWSRLRTEIT